MTMKTVNRLAGMIKAHDYRVEDLRSRRTAADADVRTDLSDRAARVSAATRFRSILVPVDGQAFGEHALPLALGIARRAGATVRLVHVHSPLQSAYAPQALYYNAGLDKSLRRQRLAYFNDLVKRVERVAEVDVSPRFLLGREVADSLIEEAAGDVDLVVMATHGRGPLGRLWFGSTGDALMDRLAVPMVVVPGGNTQADLDADPTPRRVLVPLDGAESSRLILAPALALGELADAEHALLRVVPWESEGADALHPMRAPIAFDPARASAWDDLCRLADEHAGSSRRVGATLLHTDRSVADAIVDFAAREADFIALTTKRRSPLARLFGRSVARQVMRRASTPVMVLPVAGKPAGAKEKGRAEQLRPQTRHFQENVR
jgi:nucleotide-binding universal stress UspA family protein